MIQLREILPEDMGLFTIWLAAPHVRRWYSDAPSWINEVNNRSGEFQWIHHFIAEQHGRPFGFCQYYSCSDSGEPMGGYARLEGTYSIDYLIGEADFLSKGFGKLIVALLTEKIKLRPDAKRIAVFPNEENVRSRALLKSCGFEHDEANDVFVKSL